VTFREAGGPQEIRIARSRPLGFGTLACPHCDAPVAPAAGGMSVTDGLGCPFCLHAGLVREFLSLAAPTRPARVELRVVRRHRG
jgi:hypothetical protein